MKILQQLQKHGESIISVHKHGKIYLLFTLHGIYAWGDKKEVEKFAKNIEK